MKLISKCQIGGVEVLKRVHPRHKQFSIKKNTALPGDIYEGPEKHIDLGYATAIPQQPDLDEPETGADDEAKQKAADEKAVRITELKQRAKELGATDGQLRVRSESKLLDLIEKLGEGEGEGDGGSDDEGGSGSDDGLGI